MVSADKKRYLPLLFPKDGQEGMIARYLNRGTLFVLEENGAAYRCATGSFWSGRFDASGTVLRLFGAGSRFFGHLAKLGCKNIVYFTNFTSFHSVLLYR